MRAGLRVVQRDQRHQVKTRRKEHKRKSTGWGLRVLGTKSKGRCIKLTAETSLDSKPSSSLGGLEPPTFRLTAERANRLRHRDQLLQASPVTSCNENGFPRSLPTAAKKRFKRLYFGSTSPALETLSLGAEHARRRTRNPSELGLGRNNAKPTTVLASSWPPPKQPATRDNWSFSRAQVLHFPLVIGLTGRTHGTCPGALEVARDKNSNWLCPHCTAPSRRLQRINSTGHDLELAHHARNGAWHPAVAQEMLGGGCIPSQRLGVVGRPRILMTPASFQP